MDVHESFNFFPLIYRVLTSQDNVTTESERIGVITENIYIILEPTTCVLAFHLHVYNVSFGIVSSLTLFNCKEIKDKVTKFYNCVHFEVKQDFTYNVHSNNPIFIIIFIKGYKQSHKINFVTQLFCKSSHINHSR